MSFIMLEYQTSCVATNITGHTFTVRIEDHVSADDMFIPAFQALTVNDECRRVR